MFKIATTPKQKIAARKMAAYFDQHLTVSDLLKWASLVLQYDNDRKLQGLISHLTGDYLPGLIQCKDSKEVRQYNTDALPLLFDCMLYHNTKSGIDSITRQFKKDLATKLMLADEVCEFFDLTTHINFLNEIYLAIEQNRKAA